MSSCILYRKHEYIIVRNGNNKGSYYTVINTKLNTHIHINNNIKLCKIIVQKAIKNDYYKCSEFMKHKIEILLGLNKDWNNCHKTNIHLHNLY